MDCQEPSCIEEPRQLGHQSCAATDWILGDEVADLIAGATDCSQGSETVICMIAAEGSIVSAPPAVMSAIHYATGIWFKELPIKPEKLIKALKEKGEATK